MSAPNILPGNNDLEKLHALCELTYQQQAVWFLNSFWEENNLEQDAECLWNYVHKCAELDVQKHGEGSGLDEMKAHVFLEQFKETLTVRELRAKLRSTGAIGEKERPKVVPLTHYLLFKYNVDWHLLVNAAQGDNSKAIAEAQALLNAVSAAFAESEAAHSAATAALLEAQSKANEAAKQEAEAKTAAENAKVTEAKAQESAVVAKQAQSELEVALAEVQKQEDAYNSKTEELKQKSETGGVVSRNKAKNELAQHLGEDPLPLRRAKITAEAAVKRAEKTAKKSAEDAEKAAAARANAEKEAAEAEAARKSSDEAAVVAANKKAEAEAKLQEAREKVAEAEAKLEEVKQKPGSALGAIWWMERELYEQKKYLPESKGGIRK